MEELKRILEEKYNERLTLTYVEHGNSYDLHMEIITDEKETVYGDIGVTKEQLSSKENILTLVDNLSHFIEELIGR